MTSISSQFKIIRDDLNSADKKLADDIEYLSGVVTDFKSSSQNSLESIAKVWGEYGERKLYVCMYVCRRRPFCAQDLKYMYVCMYVCMYICICVSIYSCMYVVCMRQCMSNSVMYVYMNV